MEGVYVSDDAENWYVIPPIRDAQTGEELLTNEFYSAGVSSWSDTTILWIGSNDGLASSIDGGNNWTIHRDFRSTRESIVPDTYAYPTPFSPSRDGYIRFQYDIKKSGEVFIDIYDFALDKVVSIREYEELPVGGSRDRNVKWNGKNDTGEIVASGVYFFRVNINNEIHWGKLVVIN